MQWYSSTGKTCLECDCCGVDTPWQLEPYDPELWAEQGWVKVGWDTEFREYFHACPDCAKKPREDWMWDCIT